MVGPDAAAAGCSFARSLVDPLAIDTAADPLLGLLTSPAPLASRLPSVVFADAHALFALLARESEARRPGFEAMVRLKLIEALLLLSRALAPSSAIAPQGHGDPRRHVDDVTGWIQEHYADPLSLPDIAARFGHNPSYFSRLFHRMAGMTLVEYINRVRIQKSCQLLKRSEAGITEIALAVGYNNISHFNRFFRRIMDMSPREYRRRSRK